MTRILIMILTIALLGTQAHAKGPEAFDLSTGSQQTGAASEGQSLLEALIAISQRRRGGFDPGWSARENQRQQREQKLNRMEFQMRMMQQEQFMRNGGYGG